MRVALLSNVTVDFVTAGLKKEHEVYQPAGFDSWQREVYDGASGLYSFSPEVVVILLHMDWRDWRLGQWDDAMEIVQGWLSAIGVLCERLPGIPVLVSSLDVRDSSVRSLSEPRLGSAVESSFLDGISRLGSAGNRAYVLPVHDIVMGMGRDAFYSEKMWYAASMPWSAAALGELVSLCLLHISAFVSERKKCLAVDLDNTLWGGVVGEDGAEGIILGSSKKGACYRDAQRVLLEMRKRGVMLAILSKNNREDVEAAFARPEMVLSREDFVAEAIDWNSKPQNIRALAEELNIGLDAFVFLDDNPAERAQMLAECPEVTVAEFPTDVSALPRSIDELWQSYFLCPELSREDVSKTEMYRSEARRKAALRSATSVEDYLSSLQMRMDLHGLREEEVVRAAQLAGKTNQFNVTTIRYSQEQLRRIVDDEQADALVAYTGDKYGDQGLVALVVLRYGNDVADIESFLMSCRVMGRDVEVEICSCLRHLLECRNIKRLRAAYERTAKNAPVKELYDRLGFSRVAEGSEGLGSRTEYEGLVKNLPSSTGYFRHEGGVLECMSTT